MTKETVAVEVVLVRHGETDANKHKICQGQSDFPLNSQGIHAARRTGRHYRDQSWALVYSSDLSRAYDVRARGGRGEGGGERERLLTSSPIDCPVALIRILIIPTAAALSTNPQINSPPQRKMLRAPGGLS